KSMSQSDIISMDKVDNTDAVSSVNGKIGNVTITKADVGLGNVDNFSKAELFSSPSFQGEPTAPTPEANDSSSRIATTQYVQDALLEIIDGSVASADKLSTARNINITGDVNIKYSFDGSEDINATAILKTYENLAGTYSAVNVNNKGLVTSGAHIFKVIDSLAEDISDVAIGGLVFVTEE
uniref:hypothetical protein n=1 Tax=Mammaliicoccus vitulinus TaxID=71237 RepID=UPI00248BBC28